MSAVRLHKQWPGTFVVVPVTLSFCYKVALNLYCLAQSLHNTGLDQLVSYTARVQQSIQNLPSDSTT